jgi:mannose-1-phosphate guanylyltransferase/mannose-6-phosphate isomerase
MALEVDDTVYAVILAGGSGTRFWPKSRQNWPKQLCRIGGSEETMIEMTLNRLDGFIPPERRIIVTHKDQARSTREIVAGRCAVILAEPEARNTANALALAALEISKRSNNPNAIMISFHADHIIERVNVLKEAVRTAVTVAKTGQLCLLGIVPKYAETGYGYIERGEPISEKNSFKVASFREKPDRATAELFLAEKKFFWNAGLFVFPVNLILQEIRARLPETISGLSNLLASSSSFESVDEALFSELYSKLPKISIDHAVLEVSNRVCVVEADIGWQDIGSWDALSQCFPTDDRGNYSQGDVMLLDTDRCIVESDGPFTVLLGMKDTVVVHEGGVVLVCPKEHAQNVRIVVDELKARGRSELI